MEGFKPKSNHWIPLLVVKQQSFHLFCSVQCSRYFDLTELFPPVPRQISRQLERSLRGKSQLGSFRGFDTIPACDGRTDERIYRQTHDDCIYRASMVSCGKKLNPLLSTCRRMAEPSEAHIVSPPSVRHLLSAQRTPTRRTMQFCR